MLIILESVLDGATLAQFRQLLADARWQDGSATAGTLARSVKRNHQLADSDPLAVRLGEQILQALGRNPRFISAALPRRIYPPKFNRYAEQGSYGVHVDSAIMGVPGSGQSLRTDLSATLFLAEPAEYEGGELEIETPFGAQVVKLAAGDMVLYPSTSLHRVAPVTRGARVASFFWIESMVADEAARSLLFDLDQAIQGLTPGLAADDDRLLKLTSVYHNLLRRWAQA
ncbi:Fe2+-dependent dioxygenase [Aquabacterium sp. OR-4]|uniref:Fe2+-dependent dioxygenase n=1 Tax=Aquabacterium sp. OR-4 TaxID=2978127 RepID=UPI0021B21E28|nr:Fe2+-dependent dioxygenase [Aquabacterium sp. OR-4]MDT7834289.1 Fe2+-dependent dioxygenase [Aquabacterium sp. OR-4]